MRTSHFALLSAACALALAACGGSSATCVDDASLCSGAARCNADTGQCEAAAATDCVASPSVCGAGTTCDSKLKLCVPGSTGAADCRVDAGLCASGTTCDTATGRCTAVTSAASCQSAPALCGEGTTCNAATGACDPDVDCHAVSTCGPGTICGPEGACAGDCRADLLGTCTANHLCDRTSGVCDVLPAVDCTKVPSLCWEDQTCDPSGYCAEAEIDAELDYDVQLYDVTVDVDTLTDTFNATEKLFFKATKAATASIVIDVGATVSGWTPYTVTAVTDHAGKAISFAQDSTTGELTATLSAPLDVGAGEVLTLAYHGPLNPITDPNDPLYLSGLMHRVGNDGTTHLVQTFGWPDSARRWLPSHDHPSDAARAIITVGVDDATLEPFSNGVPVSDQMVNGFHRRTFVLRQPVPTYALFMGAGPFTRTHLGVVDGVSMDAYTYKADSAVPLMWWTGVLGELHYFNDHFGGAYPFERYALLELPDPYGAMEHASVVDIADWWIHGDPADSQDPAIHEMIHHWWGDNAHLRSWEEYWLNESMASYFTIDTYRAETGATAYQNAMDLQKANLFKDPLHYADDALRYQHATEDAPGKSTSASLNAPYAKGPWVWHMLRATLGEDTFWAVVQAFYKATRFKKYDTELLLQTVNSVSGVDHTQFFQEWVYQRGWPVISAAWTYDKNKHIAHVTATQVQDPAWGTYTFAGPMALEYDLDDDDPTTATCKVSLSFSGGATTAAANGPCSYAPTTMKMPLTWKYLVQLQ